MKFERYRRYANRRQLVVSIAAVVVLAVIAGLLVSRQHHTSSPQAQMKATVAAVSKILELPTNEQPTLATVTNQTEVRKQPFFIHASNGDKVLLYANNKLAVLYRPSAHKIINVGPINGTVSYARFSVTIRNGTTNDGFLTSAKNKLTASFPNINIAGSETAQRTNFPKTIVIPIKDGDQDLAEQLADTLGGQVGIMPTGEDTPSSDLLIILGQDYKS